MLSSDLATRWQPAGTCPGIRRRRRWLLVVGLDGVVGGELPVLQPGELLDRRVILRDHRPALFIGQYGALHHPLRRSEEHTSELQSLMRISYAVFCLKKKNNKI